MPRATISRELARPSLWGVKAITPQYGLESIGVGIEPGFTVETSSGAEPEPLPDEFSPARLRHSLLILGAVVLVVVALIVLVPGLASLRDRLAGAQPGWLAVAALLQLGSCAG